MPKKITGKSKRGKEQFKIRVVVDHEQVTERIYSNYVVSNINPLDVSLEFCEIDPEKDKPTKSEKRGGTVEIKARPKARIVLSYQVFRNLVDMLHKQVKSRQD